MRALIVELQGRGGFWHYANALGGALSQAGVEIALATTRGYEQLAASRVPVHLIDEGKSSKPPLLAAVRRTWNHAAKLARLGRLLETYRPEIVHLQGPIGRLDFLYFPWLKAGGASVVYTAHNPRPRTGGAGLLDRARYQSADAIVTLSRVGMRDLIEDGVPAEKISYVPHGNYLELCSRSFAAGEARRALGLPQDARVILFFGGIAPYKGLDTLIDAVGYLHKGSPDAHLVIAGPSRRPVDAYRARIARRELTAAVTLRPQYVPLADMPLYFSAADVVALPYRRSYQSGVLQLAYGFSRPVVVSRTSELGEQVLEDETGLVAALNPVDFSAALSEILSDGGRAAAMGRRGRQLAETKYSWEAIARQSVEMYERVRAQVRTESSGFH